MKNNRGKGQKIVITPTPPKATWPSPLYLNIYQSPAWKQCIKINFRIIQYHWLLMSLNLSSRVLYSSGYFSNGFRQPEKMKNGKKRRITSTHDYIPNSRCKASSILSFVHSASPFFLAVRWRDQVSDIMKFKSAKCYIYKRSTAENTGEYAQRTLIELHPD